MALEDVVDAQKDPYFNKLAAEAGTPENTGSRTIQTAWGDPTEAQRETYICTLTNLKE